jgi:hypothetical protein
LVARERKDDILGPTSRLSARSCDSDFAPHLTRMPSTGEDPALWWRRPEGAVYNRSMYQGLISHRINENSRRRTATYVRNTVQVSIRDEMLHLWSEGLFSGGY